MNVTINFNCNQYELAQMMMTIGAVGIFDEIKRKHTALDEQRFNTAVTIKSGSDRHILENMLTALKINYAVDVCFGVQQDA